MKWVMLIGGVLVGVVVLVAVVGAMLPVRHVAARTARVGRPPAEVFALVTDFGGAARWRSDLERVELLPARHGHPAFREHGRHGATTMEVDELTAPERLVVRIADPDLPFGGTWTWELRPDGAGTAVTITERGEVKNPIFRFLSRFVFGHTATIDKVLGDLGRHWGETVSPSAAG